MAEPDWTLIQLTLQQLQADNAEFRGLFGQVLDRLASVEKSVERARLQITYALGQTTDANLRTVDVEDSVDVLKARIEALTHRVDRLEHSDA